MNPNQLAFSRLILDVMVLLSDYFPNLFQQVKGAGHIINFAVTSELAVD